MDGAMFYEVGDRGDAASRTGSLHAKLNAGNIKSWQRVTGATAASNADKVFTITSVTPSKCLVFINGVRFVSWAAVINEITITGAMPVEHYISAFSATSLTLSVCNNAPVGSGTWIAGTLSIEIIEFY